MSGAAAAVNGIAALRGQGIGVRSLQEHNKAAVTVGS